jgi:Spy/CpxP family protein refolding chaperone
MQKEGDTHMKKRNIVMIAAIALAALAIVPFVYAGPGQHMHGDGSGGGRGMAMLAHLGHLKDKLDLSDQQVDQIKAIVAEAHQQNAQYRDQLHGGMKDVAQALLKNPNDLAGAQALLDQQSAAENALKTNMLQATSKALNVLTAEQRGKLATMLTEHAGRWEARRQ